MLLITSRRPQAGDRVLGCIRRDLKLVECFAWLDLVTLSSQLSDLRSQLSDLRSQISALSSQISDLCSQLSDLRSQLRALRSQLRAIRSQLKAFRTRISADLSSQTQISADEHGWPAWARSDGKNHGRPAVGVDAVGRENHG